MKAYTEQPECAQVPALKKHLAATLKSAEEFLAEADAQQQQQGHEDGRPRTPSPPEQERRQAAVESHPVETVSQAHISDLAVKVSASMAVDRAAGHLHGIEALQGRAPMYTLTARAAAARGSGKSLTLSRRCDRCASAGQPPLRQWWERMPVCRDDPGLEAGLSEMLKARHFLQQKPSFLTSAHALASCANGQLSLQPGWLASAGRGAAVCD